MERTMSQADYNLPLDYEALNKLAADLGDHADGIENITAHQLEKDIRTAVTVIEEHACWRLGMKESIAQLRSYVEQVQTQQITLEKLFANVLSVAEDLETLTGDA
jgi:hypothetical protein